MAYELLSHLYYKDKEKQKALYVQRKSSEAAYVLPIKIGENEAFFCLCPEIHNVSLKIMQTDKRIAEIKSNLPKKALEQFAKKCLIDEIRLTNDIEGIYSTRRELASVLNEMSNKAKKKRFYGLLKKYSMLNGNNVFPLNTSTDIREIYDDLVLREVAEDCPENVPDGEIFLFDYRQAFK